MRYFSSFAGVGGMELLFPKEWELVAYSEWDKYASMVHKFHTPNVQNYGDISKIKWERVSDFDMLTGGTPCQNFSIAGKREGISGDKSKLVWEFIRCLKEKKPRYFIFENVKGLLSSRGGFDFANILTAFSEERYDLWWQVLNAKYFGVPQNRERIFVVGSRITSPREVFFERENSKTIVEVSRTIRNGGRGSVDGKHTWDIIKVLNKGESQHYLLYEEKGIAPNLVGSVGMSSQKHPFIKKGFRVRKLMPVECERLMGWSNNWTKWGINEKGEKVEISDSQRYRQCGNGCVPQCVKWIVENVL